MDLRQWVSEGLMTFFFLVVGLEARREFDLGALRERRRVGLLVFAAAGGMTVPVLIFLAFNAGGDGAGGWGAAMSTDTAFALGVLALVAPRATRLRVSLADARGDRRPGGAAGDRDGLHRPGGDRCAGRCGRLLLPAPGAALRADGLARAGGRHSGGGGVGCPTRVGRRPAAHRAGRGVRRERVSPGANRPGARNGAHALVSRAAHARARPVRTARRDLRDLGERATPVPAASLDELRDRAAVRARERRHPRRRGAARRRDHLADHAGDRVRLRGRQAGRADRRSMARDTGHQPAPHAELARDRRRRRRCRDSLHRLAAGREHRLRGPAARGGKARRARRRDRGGADAAGWCSR